MQPKSSEKPRTGALLRDFDPEGILPKGIELAPMLDLVDRMLPPLIEKYGEGDVRVEEGLALLREHGRL